MKATRIVDCRGPNPGYDANAKKAAEANGETYGVPEHIQYKAGSVNEHPDVWMLCVMEPPKCTPLDDDCRKIVEKYFNDPHRKAELAKLKSLCVPEVFRTLPKGLQDYVRVVAPKWLKDVELPPGTPTTSGGSGKSGK